ncbi:uncharacterized protein [Miscanthus floridulus]|uniref:uncharacterized protein n=1 Tax=Miscanthus floridulus TaxID=154761 RepID=UPI0034584521
MLMKAASSREPVPTGVFANDQHKPSVRYEGSKWANDGPSNPAPRADPPTAPSKPKVMELEEDPTADPDPLNDWRMLYLDYLLCDTLLMHKTEARQLACHANSFVLIEGKLYKRGHTGIL